MKRKQVGLFGQQFLPPEPGPALLRLSYSALSIVALLLLKPGHHGAQICTNLLDEMLRFLLL